MITIETWQRSHLKPGMSVIGWSVKDMLGHTTTDIALGHTQCRSVMLNQQNAVCLRHHHPPNPVFSGGNMALATHHAMSIAFESDFIPCHVSAIQHKQTTRHWFANTKDQFERFSRLHGADDAHQWGKNTHRCTTSFF